VEGSLTSFIDEVCGDAHLRVEDDLGDGFVRLRTSEAQRRQAEHDIRCSEDIIIEMLRNAFDAGAKNIFVATSREGDQRRICVIDDGEGIPRNMQDMIFEPRVTSKLDSMHLDKWGVHGRGMALYSISVNAKDAHVAASGKGKGSSFLVVTDLQSLPEKTDQSTMPSLSYDEKGSPHIKGPHNIARAVAEFAWEYEGKCTVYMGSPTEMAATLYGFGNATVTKGIRAFCDDLEELPLAKRLCMAVDPSSFTDIAAGLGLAISQRSARRIIDGDVLAQGPLLESLGPVTEDEGERPSVKKRKKGLALHKDPRGLKIDPKDLQEFTDGIKAAYTELAKRYYLEERIVPEVMFSSKGIHVEIPVSKLS